MPAAIFPTITEIIERMRKGELELAFSPIIIARQKYNELTRSPEAKSASHRNES